MHGRGEYAFLLVTPAQNANLRAKVKASKTSLFQSVTIEYHRSAPLGAQRHFVRFLIVHCARTYLSAFGR
jgi:hypothetical protein